MIAPHGAGDRYAEIAGLRAVVLQHVPTHCAVPAPVIRRAVTEEWGDVCARRFERVLRWLRAQGLVVTSGRPTRFEYRREGIMIDYLNIEIRAWPPGSAGNSKAIHALHTPTGVAVVVNSEPTREHNQKLAVERVQLLLTEANSPGGWMR